MEYIVIALMSVVIGFIAGYLLARFNDNRWITVEREQHKMAMLHETERHAAQVAKNGMMFDIEKRELTRRHTNILDEISQVTGIDKIELPSFGTMYLNHSKHVREAMRELYEEDESDGAYD